MSRHYRYCPRCGTETETSHFSGERACRECDHVHPRRTNRLTSKPGRAYSDVVNRTEAKEATQ